MIFNIIPNELIEMVIQKSNHRTISRLAKSEKALRNMVYSHITRTGLFLTDHSVEIFLISKQQIQLWVYSPPNQKFLITATDSLRDFEDKFSTVLGNAKFGSLFIEDMALPATHHFFPWLLSRPTRFETITFSLKSNDPVKFSKTVHKAGRVFEKYKPKKMILETGQPVRITQNEAFDEANIVLQFTEDKAFFSSIRSLNNPAKFLFFLAVNVDHRDFIGMMYRKIELLLQSGNREILLRCKATIDEFQGMANWTTDSNYTKILLLQSYEENHVYAREIDEGVHVYIFYSVRKFRRASMVQPSLACIFLACTGRSLEDVKVHQQRHLDDCKVLSSI